jgi:hypothetical protein
MNRRAQFFEKAGPHVQQKGNRTHAINSEPYRVKVLCLRPNAITLSWTKFLHMFTGIAIFASVLLWLMVKEKGFRKVVFIGAGVIALIGAGVATWYYGFRLPAETRRADEEKAKLEATAKYKIEQPSPEEVKVRGPDGKVYDFPPGTTKDSAIAYFKKKGIGVASDSNKEPDGFIKTGTILYGDYDLSGRAVGAAEINDTVKVVERNNIYSTLRVKDVHNGLLGWVSEDNVQIVTVKPAPVHASLLPCPSNDPFGIRSANPCQPPSPKKGAPPCPTNDPVGLNTTQPCTPLPPQ